MGEIFNLLTTKLFCISFGLSALPIPPMFRIERPTITITADKIRLAVVLALAAAGFLYLAVMVGTKAAQVGEDVRSTISAADDMIDEHGRGPASWDCAAVPISIQCGGSEPPPGE